MRLIWLLIPAGLLIGLLAASEKSLPLFIVAGGLILIPPLTPLVRWIGRSSLPLIFGVIGVGAWINGIQTENMPVLLLGGLLLSLGVIGPLALRLERFVVRRRELKHVTQVAPKLRTLPPDIAAMLARGRERRHAWLERARGSRRRWVLPVRLLQMLALCCFLAGGFSLAFHLQPGRQLMSIGTSALVFGIGLGLGALYPLLAKDFLRHDAVVKALEFHGRHDGGSHLKLAFERRQPFTLFLRNFERERTNWAVDHADGDPQNLFSFVLASSDRASDAVFLTALSGRSPVYMIGNVEDPLPALCVEALYATDDDWLTVVRFLIAHAHLIVLQAEDASPGVVLEVEAIRAVSAVGRTLVITTSDAPLFADMTRCALDDVPSTDDPDLMSAFLEQMLAPGAA